MRLTFQNFDAKSRCSQQRLCAVQKEKIRSQLHYKSALKHITNLEIREFENKKPDVILSHYYGHPRSLRL